MFSRTWDPIYQKTLEHKHPHHAPGGGGGGGYVKDTRQVQYKRWGF